MKLTVFHSETPISVILFRSKYKCTNEMIVWDRSTDTFTRGQWLKRKTIWLRGCTLFPDGKHFRYHYENQEGAFVVTSKVLNFTAIPGGFKQAKCGRWFIEEGTNGPGQVPDGYRFEGGKIFKGDKLLENFENDEFKPVDPI